MSEMQLVQVQFTENGTHYTYGWDVEVNIPLNVGDTVLVPPNMYRPHPAPARVSILGSSYKGKVAEIEAVMARNGS